jgi:phage terminase large subunit GpA-like protein
VDPSYDLVHFRESDEQGKPIPETAELRCARCNAVITDEERARAVWPPDMREGGTGRRWTPMSDEEAAKRDYLGFGVHGLVDPYVSVVNLARKVEGAPDEAERQSAMNVACGEAYKPREAVIDANAVEAVIKVSDRIVVPGGRKGCWFLTVGTDVQAPRENPTFVSAAVAWSGLGHAHIVELVAIKGSAAWLDWLSSLSVALGEPHQATGMSRMGVDAVGIDDAWPPDVIKDLCRTVLYSQVSSARIDLVPMRFVTGGVGRDVPFKLRDEKKRINPTRPELGKIPMYDLYRHPWVDRVARRVSESRMTVLCRPPRDFQAQMTANVLRPLEQKHSWEAPRLEWEKIKDGRDDWMMALAYAEAVAAITLELDSIHELAYDDGPSEGVIVPQFML